MTGLRFAFRQLTKSPDFTAVAVFSLASGALLLAFIAVFAAGLPARRAARVDPIIALRAE